MSEIIDKSKMPEGDIATDNDTIPNTNDTSEDKEISTKDQIQMLRNIQSIMNILKETIQTVEHTWLYIQGEYQLTDSMMKELYVFNENNRINLPEDATNEEKESYDRYNGIDKLTDEDVIRIFDGKSSIVAPFSINITIDRIKDAMDTFFTLLANKKEYMILQKEYSKIVEDAEKDQMTEMKQQIDLMPECDEKDKLTKAYDEYYYFRNLGFLGEINESEQRSIGNAWNDETKIQYWLKRARDKMKQLKIPETFVLTLSGFEKKFLDEKYHKNNNLLLLYFLMRIMSAKDSVAVKNNPERTKVVSIVYTIDAFMNGSMDPKRHDVVLNNIIKLHDIYYEILQGECNIK